MFRSVIPRNTAALLILAASMASVHADQGGTALAVVMTNDPQANQIKVYDTRTQALLQTLSTQGKGGVGGNARGVKQLNGELLDASRITADAALPLGGEGLEQGLGASVVDLDLVRLRIIRHHHGQRGAALIGMDARHTCCEDQ